MKMYSLRAVACLVFVSLVIAEDGEAQGQADEIAAPPRVAAESKGGEAVREILARAVEREPAKYARDPRDAAAITKVLRDSAYSDRVVHPASDEGRRRAAESALADEVLQAYLQNAVRDTIKDLRSDTPKADDASSASEGDVSDKPMALVAGGGDTGSAGSATPLPSGEGSNDGMGQNFTPDLTSGEGSYQIPIALAAGRKGIEPSVSLAYATTGSNGIAGFGWNISQSSISRQSDRGMPRYKRSADGLYHGEEDSFVGGSGDLVPVSSERAALVDGYGYAVPADLRGFQEYRSRLSAPMERYFRSPDAQRWVVLGQDGKRSEFGVVPEGQGPAGIGAWSQDALVVDEYDAERVFRWNLTKVSDAYGSTMYFSYLKDQGETYPAEIYYVSPNTCAATANPSLCSAPLSTYAARVAFEYENRPDVFASYASGFRVVTAKRLSRITVTSAGTVAGERFLLRRYHLAYDASSFHSLLTRVQLEGRPEAYDVSVGAMVASRFVSESSLNSTIVGVLEPALTFEYTSAPVSGPQIAGFGGVDTTLRQATVPASIPAVGNALADFQDVNADGLPDLLVTDPARYRTASGAPAVGVFFNGFTGRNAAPAHAGTFSEAVSVVLEPSAANALSLASPNIVPMDVDGDGRADLLHMPRKFDYGFFTPTRAEDGPLAPTSPADQKWRYTYARVQIDRSEGDPRVDLTANGTTIRTLDVNGDNLVDVVQTTGSSMLTWLNLGWVPNGEGRFGSATFQNGEYVLSTDPVESCLLRWGNLPVDFGSSETQLADMNGDGVTDIVLIRDGRVVYWPGRGVGHWGDGASACRRGDASPSAIVMENPPRGIIETSELQFHDVNMDGATDLLRVRYDGIDVWFNRAGHGFTAALTIAKTPRAPSFWSNVRVIDIDGSATSDIVWADAGRFQYVDMMGGRRPRLLKRIYNGRGATSEIAYGTSAEDYLRDLRNAESCNDSSCDRFTWSRVGGGCDEALLERSGNCVYRSGGSPFVSTVVRSITSSDRFDVMGFEANVSASAYEYHDGYYEGFSQEFRGFGASDVVGYGDPSQPSLITRTWVHQGRRNSEIASDRLAENPHDVLKGFAYLAEIFDASGVYYSSKHTAFTVRHLLTGLDGQQIMMAYARRSDEARYDTAPFSAGTSALTVPSVRFEAVQAGGGIAVTGDDADFTMRLRSGGYALLRATTEVVDNLGNSLQETHHGRVRGEHGETVHEPITTHSVYALVSPERGLVRPVQSWLTGHGFDPLVEGYDRLQETETVYNLEGDQVSSSQTARVRSTRLFAGDGRAEGFTQTTQTLVASKQLDAWGSPVALCSGADLSQGANSTECLRYQEHDYDAAYAQLLTQTRTAVSRSSGMFRFLTVSQVWDRGAGRPVSETDTNGVVTDSGFDGLGRVTFVRLPSSSPTCAASTIPTQRFSYAVTPGELPLSITYSYRHTDCTTLTDDESIIEERVYEDGFGRERAQLTRAGAGLWIKSGVVRLNARGNPYRAYRPVFVRGVQPAPTQVLSLPASPFTEVRRDAYGRDAVQRDESGNETHIAYHALSEDTSDPLDLGGDPVFSGTPTTVRRDGHERVIGRVLRNRSPDRPGMEYYHAQMTYRADSALLSVQRFLGGSAAQDATRLSQTERTFAYDSLQRRITSQGADTDSSGGAAWIYLFNAVGDTVAVRDPRGCGQNYYYDFSGRLLGEDYVGCSEAAPRETMPTTAIGEDAIALTAASGRTVDVVMYYDIAPPWASGDLLPATSFSNGELTGSLDRAQRSVFGYTRAGASNFVARQVTLISDASSVSTSLSAPPALQVEVPGTPSLQEFDEENTYVRQAEYDHAGRARIVRLPRAPDWNGSGLLGPVVEGEIRYDARGLANHVEVSVGGVSHVVIESMEYNAEGRPTEIVYGDAQGGAREATVSLFEYDEQQRVRFAVTERAPTAVDLGTRPLGAVTRAFGQSYTWDEASNLTQINDERYANEWPDGYRPQRTHVFHDALYRVTHAQFSYRHDGSGGGIPGWSPFDEGTDWREELERTNTDGRSHLEADPMRSRPAPLVSSMSSADRVADLTWDWDWLGNMTEWTDDASMFYERSIGRITNGAESSGRPSGLYLASNIRTTAPGSGDPGVDQGGWVEVDYGDSGNVQSFTVHGQCHDVSVSVACYDSSSQSLGTRRGNLRSRCRCEVEQHYQYRWDEVNRLADARRYDRSGGTGTYELAARQRYLYDANNQRIVKHAVGIGAEVDRLALHPFPGDFERRGVVRGDDEYEHDTDLGTENNYLLAGSRIVWDEAPSYLSAGEFEPGARVVVSLSDVVQSNNASLDLVSGELLDYSTFYPNGARESFRTQEVTSVAPPPLGFTGKEADEEVGVVYFGERYLISRLGRWATPDPAEIHALSGGDVLNFYHYVQGNILQARDPLGLSAETREVRGQIEYRLPSDKWTSSKKEFASAWIKDGFVKAITAELQGFADLLNISFDDLKGLVDAVKASPFGFAKEVLGGIGADLREALADAYSAWRDDGSKGYEAMGRLAAKGALILVGALTGGAGAGAAKLAAKGLGKLGKGVKEGLDKVADAMRARKNAPCAINSFVAGTLVLTSHGAQPIETIRVGDEVVAQPEAGGEPDLKPVVNVIEKLRTAVLALELIDEDGETYVVEATAGHPFAVEGQGWVEARRLSEGDLIPTFGGGFLQVTGGTWLRQEQLVYNLEVADFHTYFLAESGAWVHNCKGGGGGTYDRPKSFRTGVRDKAWDSAVEPATGRVRDPLTGQFMSKHKSWDMGHKDGYEFRKHQSSAAERGIDRGQFLDEHNDPSHYRPELPGSNRSHRAENKSNDYFGP